MKRKLFTALVLFFCCSVLFGLTIAEYNFDITGKTKESAVRRLIVPAKVEEFETVEELEEALSEKRQMLINTRLVLEDTLKVDYEIVEEDTVVVNVSFKDAKSRLIVPYPKYDSNTGFNIGLRYYQENLLGTYATLLGRLNAAEQEGSFKTGSYSLELPFENIKAGNANFSFVAKAEYDFLKYKGSYLSLDFKEDGFKIGNVGVGVSASVKMVDTTTLFKPFNINPSLLNKERGAEASMGASVSEVRIGDVRFDDSVLFKFKESSKWEPYSIENNFKTYFEGKLENLTYVNVLTKYPKSEETSDPYYKDTNTLSYEFSPYITGSLLFNATGYKQAGMTKQEMGVRASASKGRLDYKKDFRKGTTFNYSATLYGRFKKTAAEHFVNADLEFNIISYPFMNSWFNPSVRVQLFANDEKKNFFEEKENALQERLRGILLKDSMVQQGGLKSNIAAVTNINLTFKVMEIKNFATCYGNVFCDSAIFAGVEKNADNKNSMAIRGTAGVECVGILKNYPSYPIRASLGYDIKSLVERNFRDFELFIGVGWIY